MTTITLQSKKEKHTASIPDGWHELPMDKFIEILKQGENIDDVKFVSILSGLSVKDIERCENIKEWEWLVHQLKHLYDYNKLEEESKEPLTEFEFEGEKFSVSDSFGNASIGEYYSLMKLEKGLEQKQWHLFPLFLSTMYRPQGEEYDNVKCLERSKQFSKLPVMTYYKARNFFLFLQSVSKINIQTYGKENQAA